MQQPIMIHLTNEELILGDIDQLPDPSDRFMIVHNARQPDGITLVYLQEDVTIILIPWQQIKMVQILPSTGIEEVIGFVRE
jgi:hypothetical protein